MQSTPRSERVVIGADFNGHARAGNRGDEEVMVLRWERKGQMVVVLTKGMEME